MSTIGMWGSGLLLSAMLNWCKWTAFRFWRFACRLADRPPPVAPENRCAVTRPESASNTVLLEFADGLAGFKEFTKVMRIGDRVRAFCDDGVIEAEKISPTRFKVIYAVDTTGAAE